MNLRSTAGLLLLGSPFWTASAAAADLRASAERHAATYGTQTTAPVAPVAAPAENPNKKIALILGGVGAGLIVAGAASRSRYDCTITTNLGVECGGGKKKALVLLGVAAGGAGAALYVIGEGKKASTAIGISPSGIGVQQRFRF